MLVSRYGNERGIDHFRAQDNPHAVQLKSKFKLLLKKKPPSKLSSIKSFVCFLQRGRENAVTCHFPKIAT